MTAAAAHAVIQYAESDGRLAARIALHQNHGTNPQSWFDWLAERLRLAGDVLEAGAGTGALWSYARTEAVRTLTLADFSAAMCARLTAVPSARVLRGDVTRLPFADGAFDTVLANHMLYHLDEPPAGVRELVRVLRPGGRLITTTNGRAHLAELDAIGPAIGRPDLQLAGRLGDFSAESAPALIDRWCTGVRVERYHCDLRITRVEPVLAYLESLADTPLTPSERAAAAAYVQTRIDTEGAFHVGKHSVLITGTKP
ncbi:class I SAM-dependent methyltransferase [Dactylosporangium sp. NPDC006015]|uniref:class I SAM-dependent methyltransferase n=1 Tax=Dactylosporangium sp. NPDC006015 TaxID=3154576 RepID=UPI0033B24269